MKKIIYILIAIICLIYVASFLYTIYIYQPTAPSPWMLDRTFKELDPLKQKLGSHKITPDVFIKMFEMHPHGDLAHENQLAHYQIVNGHVYGRTNSNVEVWKFKALTKFIKQLARARYIKNTEFIICYSDICDQLLFFPNNLIAAPVFVNAKNPNLVHKNKQLILFPDVFTMKYWPELFKRIQKKSKNTPWHNKLNKAVWRGGLSLSVIKNKERTNAATLEEYNNFARVKLIALAKAHPNKVNAAFVTGGGDKQNKDYLSQEDHLMYKYLPALDGVTVTYPGLLWRLASNSVTFKQDSPEIQWFYDIIKPNVHYVPIIRDMTDLLKQIEYAIMHDADMQKVSENAQALVNAELSPEKVMEYCATILNAYTEFLGYEPKPTLPSLEDKFENLFYFNSVQRVYYFFRS